MNEPELQEVDKLQLIRGLPFPAGVRFRQIIVTGPPGSGKTTLLRAIGGWPEEGYLDLTAAGWWRSRSLAFRPRQVHLGLPFRGIPKALTVFDGEWLAHFRELELETDRIRIPKLSLGFWDPRKKFVFDFLLPPADKILAVRRERSHRESHPVDMQLSQEQVAHQVAAYSQVANHFQRSGMRVYLRDGFGAAPKNFVQEGPPVFSRTTTSPEETERLLGGRLRKWLVESGDRILGYHETEVAEDLTRLVLQASKIRIPRRLLPLEVRLGPQKLHIYEEPLLAPRQNGETDSTRVMLFDPEEYYSSISGTLLLSEGERTRGAKGRSLAPSLPREIFSRLEIVNQKGTLLVVDLDSPTGTEITRLEGSENERRLVSTREDCLRLVRQAFGGPLRILSPGEALETVRKVNQLLEQSPNRPRDDRGHPGALVELAADLVPILVGDLHGNVDNLLKTLSENRFLGGLETGSASLILLGDAVHPQEGQMGAMDSSVLIMDLILRLMLSYPSGVVYVRGNHDGFSDEIRKQDVSQGRLWESRLLELRGQDFVTEMKRFYDLLPYLVAGEGLLACHGGPPIETVTRSRLINAYRYPRLRHQLTWNRVQQPGNPAGYSARDVRSFRAALGLDRSAVFVTAHTQLSEAGCFWLDVAGIKNHHIIDSSGSGEFAVIAGVGAELSPFVYRAEALLDLMS